MKPNVSLIFLERKMIRVTGPASRPVIGFESHWVISEYLFFPIDREPDLLGFILSWSSMKPGKVHDWRPQSRYFFITKEDGGEGWKGILMDGSSPLTQWAWCNERFLMEGSIIERTFINLNQLMLASHMHTRTDTRSPSIEFHQKDQLHGPCSTQWSEMNG